MDLKDMILVIENDRGRQHFVLYGKMGYMCAEDLHMDIRRIKKRSVWR